MTNQESYDYAALDSFYCPSCNISTLKEEKLDFTVCPVCHGKLQITKIYYNRKQLFKERLRGDQGWRTRIVIDDGLRKRNKE